MVQATGDDGAGDGAVTRAMENAQLISVACALGFLFLAPFLALLKTEAGAISLVASGMFFMILGMLKRQPDHTDAPTDARSE